LAQRFQVDTEFTGWVAAERKTELLRSTDLLAVPSLWPEPFGLVGLEAACQGVPAVGYAVGGIPDWLIGGQGGELAPGDPPQFQGLADAIMRAFADPDHYAELCTGAWRLSRRFTLDAHLRKLDRPRRGQNLHGNTKRRSMSLPAQKSARVLMVPLWTTIAGVEWENDPLHR